MYSYGPPYMAVQKQDDQHEHTFSSYVRIRDVVLKTCLGRWTIGRSGERGSGISVLPARHDDDDWFPWKSCDCKQFFLLPTPLEIFHLIYWIALLLQRNKNTFITKIAFFAWNYWNIKFLSGNEQFLLVFREARGNMYLMVKKKRIFFLSLI